MSEYKHLALFSRSSGAISEIAASFWRSRPRVQNGKIVFLFIRCNLGGAGHPLAKELHELLVDFVDRFAGLL